jgi:acyl carrier protein
MPLQRPPPRALPSPSWFHSLFPGRYSDAHAAHFADDTSFLTTGIIDSLGIGQLVAFVESTYAIRVPDTHLVPENFDSVAKLAAYVERMSKQPQTA